MAASSDGSLLIPSLQQCLENFPKGELDQVCDDKILMQFAEKFHDLHELSVYLDLTDVETNDIEQKMPPRSPKVQRFDMLRKWKEKKQEKATYRVLAKVLRQAQKLNLVDELCQLLNDVKRSHGDESQSVQLQISHEQKQALLLKPSIRKLSELHKLSSKWSVLGLQLKVKEKTLDAIEKKYGDDHVRMVKMFGEWLRCCKAPSYLVLIKALVKIGRTDIAEEICNKQKGTSLDAVKAFISESQSDSQSESEEEEQDSTSEIPVEDSPYMCEPNSKDLDTQSKSLVSQSTPLPPRPPECVLEYAEYLKCKYKAMSELPSPNWPPSIKVPVPVKIAVIDRTQPGTNTEGDENHDFDMNDYYYHESMQHDYLHGNVDNIAEYKKEIELEDVFRPKQNKSPLKVLMDGAPGVGKTTQTKKACIGWANGKMLQQFQLVILVPLREASSRRADCLEKLFCYSDDLELKKQVIKHIQKTSGRDILLIFDGYDELSEEERNIDSLYLNIIKGNPPLSQCNVLVTSRPYASSFLQTLETINRHVEVLGFTVKQIETCIMGNLNKSKAHELVHKLQERLDVISLCYVPLNCAIVMYVYQANRFTLPSTMTELYSKFILFCLKRVVGVMGHTNMKEELCSLQESELPESADSIRRQLCALSMMAYKGLCEDKLVFSYNDLNTYFSDCTDLISEGSGIESCCLGLVTSTMSFTSNGEERQYQFLHLSIQEFLAARYVANNSSDGDQQSFFCKHLKNDRFRLVLLFLSGLTKLSFPLPDTIFVEEDEYQCPYIQQNKGFLHICQLFFESQRHSELYPILLQKLPNTAEFELRWNCTLFDCMVIAHFLCATSHSWKKIDLSGCQLSDRSVATFLDVYHSYSQCMTNCEELDLRYNLPSLANSVFSIPWLSQIKTILCTDLREIESLNQLVSEPESKLAQLTTITRMPQTLQNLELEQCNLLTKCIAHGLCTNSTLKKLCLWSISAAEVVKICNSLEQHFALKELVFSWWRNDDDDSKVGDAISRLLKRNVSLETLKLSGSSVDSSDIVFSERLSLHNINSNDSPSPKIENVLSDQELVDILSATRLSSCRLKNLHLCFTKLVRTLPGTWDLVPTSRDIDPTYNPRGSDCVGYYVLKVSLPQLFCVVNQTEIGVTIPYMLQKTIDLRGADITSTRAISIFECMEHNTSVEELNLSNNEKMPLDDSSAVAQALARMIKRNNVLRKLNLSYNSVDDCIVRCIAHALEENTTLKELNLDKNVLSDTVLFKILSVSATASKAISSLTLCGVTLSPLSPRIVWSLQISEEQRWQRTLPVRSTQFFRVLKFQKTLSILVKSVDLSRTEISTDTAIKILQSLHQVVNLEQLDISSNQKMTEGDDNVELKDAFNNLLVSSKTLRILNVEECNLNDTVAEGIAEGLVKSTSLQKLNINNNPLLSENAIADILSAANKSAKCAHLIVCNHKYSHKQKHDGIWILEPKNNHHIFHASLIGKDVFKVHKASSLSSMPIIRQTFQFAVFCSTPIMDVLPSLEQISQSFGAHFLNEHKLFTCFELVPITLITRTTEWKTVRVKMTYCIRTWEHNFKATISLDFDSVTSFSTREVTFEFVTHGNISIEEALPEVQFCSLLEKEVLNKLLTSVQHDALLDQYSVHCEDIASNILKESTCNMPIAIHLSHCHISDSGAQAIATELKENKAVESIVLDWIDITAAGVSSIVQSLECNTSVRELVICTISQIKSIEEESILISTAVEKTLMQNSTLRILNIFIANSVVLKGLARGLENNAALQKLKLQLYNEHIVLSDQSAMAAVLSSANKTNLLQITLYLPPTDILVKLHRQDSKSVWNVEDTRICTLSCAIVQSTLNVHTLCLQLELDNNIITGISEVLQTLNTTISVLCLSTYGRNPTQTNTDNIIKFAGKLENLLETSTTLKELHLMNCPPSSLSRSIAAGIARSKTLKILTLEWPNVELLRSLEGNTTVEGLSIIYRSTEENDALSHAIDSLFRTNSTIKSFQLEGTLPMAMHTFSALQQNNSVVKLTISWPDHVFYTATNSEERLAIGAECCEMLKRNDTLKVLDLRDTISKHTAKAIASGLNENSSLEVLNLSVHVLNVPSQFLNDDVIAAIHSSANSSNLCILNYSDTYKFFRSNAQDTNWHLEFDSEHSELPLKLLSALGKLCLDTLNLKFSLARCEINFDEVSDRQISMLQQLNIDEIAVFYKRESVFRCNEDPQTRVKAMGKAADFLLSQFGTLKSLKVTNCHVCQHDFIMEQVATGLSRTQSLKILELSNSGITGNGAVHIIQALQYNTTVEVLDLSNNQKMMMTSDGDPCESLVASAFEAMLKMNTKLKKVYLRGLDTTNVITCIYKGLCSNQSLLISDVSGTIPDVECIEALTNMLGQNTTLTDLCITLPHDWYLHFNHIQVVRALLKNTSLKSLKIQPYRRISYEEAVISKIWNLMQLLPIGLPRSHNSDDHDMKDFLEEEMEGLRILEKPEFDSCTSSLIITELKAVQDKYV